jgi:hypothetical protein
MYVTVAFATLQKPYGSIGAALRHGESSGSKAIGMISLSDLRLFILVPFGLAVLIMLWMLWHLWRDSNRR